MWQKNQWGGGVASTRRRCLVEVGKPGLLVVMEDMLDQVMVMVMVMVKQAVVAMVMVEQAMMVMVGQTNAIKFSGGGL